jgi:hypothetical protein
MESPRRNRLPMGLAAGLLLGVLGLWGTVVAQSPPTPGAGKQPFANAVEQRDEMVRELREIRTLMTEQNELLKKLVEQNDAAAKAKR